MRAPLLVSALVAAITLVACGSDTNGRGDGPVGDGPAGQEGGTGHEAGPQPDGPAPDGPPPDGGGGDGGPGSLWLHTAGNHIYTADDQVWKGRGANLHDTRSCNACTWSPPDVGEVKRRADELVDAWGANFVRLDLESYASQYNEYQVHWAGLLTDASYFDDVKEIVAYLTAKDGVYVLLSLWVDSTFSSEGWPTAGTIDEWEALAGAFLDNPKVMYGLCNEPQYNFDGAQDAEVWTAMNDAVAAIRAIEDSAGKPHHIVTVQGTGGWARRLDYYLTHPITAGGGENVAYEVHVYNPQADFQAMWVTPAQSIPVVIGEFGPSNMSEADCTALMEQARTSNVPHLAWTFHMRCDPNLLVDNSGGGCGAGMTLAPTSWGTVLKTGLTTTW